MRTGTTSLENAPAALIISCRGTAR